MISEKEYGVVKNNIVLVVGYKPTDAETRCFRRDLVAAMTKDERFNDFTYIQTARHDDTLRVLEDYNGELRDLIYIDNGDGKYVSSLLKIDRSLLENRKIILLSDEMDDWNETREKTGCEIIPFTNRDPRNFLDILAEKLK